MTDTSPARRGLSLAATGWVAFGLVAATLYGEGTHHAVLTPLRLVCIAAVGAAWLDASLSDLRLARRTLAVIAPLFAASVYAALRADYAYPAGLWFSNALVAFGLALFPALVGPHDRRWLWLSLAALPVVALWIWLVHGAVPGMFPGPFYEGEAARGGASLTYFNPSRLGTTLLLPVAIATGMAVTALNDGRRAVAAGALGVALTGALFTLRTGSRAAALGLCLAVGVTLALAAGARARKLTLAVSGGLALAAATLIALRLRRGTDLLGTFRTEIYADALKLIVAEPAGVGLGMFRYWSDPFRTPQPGIGRYAYTAGHPHSLPLQWFAEAGWVVGGAALLAAFAILLTLARPLWARRGGQAGPLNGTFTSAIGAFLGMGLALALGTESDSGHIMALWALAFGMALAEAPLPTSPARPQIVRALGLTGSFLAFAFVVTATPGTLRAQWALDEAAQARSVSDQRLDAIERAVAIEPGDARLHVQLAHYAHALSLRLPDDMPDARQARAQAQQVVDAAFQRALELNPRYKHALLDWAQIVFDRARWRIAGWTAKGLTEPPDDERRAYATELSLADALAGRALELDPFSVVALRIQMGTHRGIGQNGAAAERATQALAIEPHFLALRLEMIELLLTIGDPPSLARAQREAATLHDELKRAPGWFAAGDPLPYERMLITVDPQRAQRAFDTLAAATPPAAAVPEPAPNP
jgi:hypothetical protein